MATGTLLITSPGTRGSGEAVGLPLTAPLTPLPPLLLPLSPPLLPSLLPPALTVVLLRRGETWCWSLQLPCSGPLGAPESRFGCLGVTHVVAQEATPYAAGGAVGRCGGAGAEVGVLVAPFHHRQAGRVCRVVKGPDASIRM